MNKRPQSLYADNINKSAFGQVIITKVPGALNAAARTIFR